VVEQAACPGVLVAEKLAEPEDVEPQKQRLSDVVSMSIGLMKGLWSDLREKGGEYSVDYEQK